MQFDLFDALDDSDSDLTDLGLQTIKEAPDESQESISQHQFRDEYMRQDQNNHIIIQNQENHQNRQPSLTHMQRKQAEYDRIEKQFEEMLQDQNQILMKQYKEQQIYNKLDKIIQPSQLRQTVQELLNNEQVLEMNDVRQRKIVNKQPNEKPQKCEKCVQYIEEINTLKLERNENNDIIKTLKMQLKKMEQSPSSLNSTKTLMRVDDVEKSKEEIKQLTQQIQKEREQFKRDLLKQQKIQSALNATKTQPIQQDELEKLKAEYSASQSQFRNKIKELQDKIKSQENILQEQDKELVTLKQKIQKQQEGLERKPKKIVIVKQEEKPEQVKEPPPKVVEQKEQKPILQQLLACQFKILQKYIFGIKSQDNIYEDVHVVTPNAVHYKIRQIMFFYNKLDEIIYGFTVSYQGDKFLTQHTIMSGDIKANIKIMALPNTLVEVLDIEETNFITDVIIMKKKDHISSIRLQTKDPEIYIQIGKQSKLIPDKKLTQESKVQKNEEKLQPEDVRGVVINTKSYLHYRVDEKSSILGFYGGSSTGTPKQALSYFGFDVANFHI